MTALTTKKVLKVELVPEVHFAITTEDGQHTSANFIVQCHLDNVYKLVNPKTHEYIMVRVLDEGVIGPLTRMHKEVMGRIFSGNANHQCEVLSMSPSLVGLLVTEPVDDIINDASRLKT